MTATEFLKSKGILTDSYATVSMVEKVVNINLAELLNEYHAIASGQKIDLDKKFENLTEKYLKEQAEKK